MSDSSSQSLRAQTRQRSHVEYLQRKLREERAQKEKFFQENQELRSQAQNLEGRISDLELENIEFKE